MGQRKFVRKIAHVTWLTLAVCGSAGCAAEGGTPDEVASVEGAAEQAGSQQQAIDNATNIEFSYQHVFGRNPEPPEVQYWLTLGRPYSTEDLIKWHRSYLQRTSGERRNTIKRSYQKVFNRLPSSNELNTWDSFIVGRDYYTFMTLCTDHEAYARHVGFASTGSYTARNWGNLSGWYVYNGRTYNVPPG
jgi:hypothetical protein